MGCKSVLGILRNKVTKSARSGVNSTCPQEERKSEARQGRGKTNEEKNAKTERGRAWTSMKEGWK